MCVVSNIGTGWGKDLPDRYPWTQPSVTNSPTREEFDALKREVEELKILLKAAKRFDEATGQKDCEMDEKVALIKRISELVGVDMSEVFE